MNLETSKLLMTPPQLSNKIKKEITDIYNLYVPRISAKGHAGSLELGLYCYRLAELLKPKSVADLGSGFTSAVFRLYQKYNPETVVKSVDDSAEWLEKTRTFLAGQKLSTENLLLWDTFQNTEETFDIVLYDLGRINTRIDNVNKPYKLVAKWNGLLILDDAHFDKEFSEKLNIKAPFLGDVITRSIIDNDFSSVTPKNETIDGFGRYAKLAYYGSFYQDVDKIFKDRETDKPINQKYPFSSAPENYYAPNSEIEKSDDSVTKVKK